MTEFMNTAPKLEHFLSNDLYDRFRTLILKRTGMLFGVKRRNALGRGITRLSKETAQSDMEFPDASDS